MGPQCEDGYFRIANELAELFASIRIPGESTQILWTILRKTYGYGKKSDRIALSQFSELTGINKPNVARALKTLSEMGIIVIEKDNNRVTTYRINKDRLGWKPLSKKITNVIEKDNASLSKKITNVIEKDNASLSKKINTKDKTTKDKRQGFFPICESWKSYLEMRKKIKKPMTEKGMELAVKKLSALHALGHDPGEVLDQSTFNSWQGLFPLRGEQPAVIMESSSGQTDEDLRSKGLIP